MKGFQVIAVSVMAGFFVWLLLQMSRTPEADRRLLMLAGAYAAIGVAIVAGGLLGRRDQR